MNATLRAVLASVLAMLLAACGGAPDPQKTDTGAGSSTGSSTGGGTGFIPAPTGSSAGGVTGSTVGGGTAGGTTPPVSGRTFLIEPGATATTDMIAAMIQALPGDTIQFGCGYFDLTSSFELTHTEDVLVKGCGINNTVLSFRGSNSPIGMLVDSVSGVTIQDLTVLDTGGNGFELRAVNHGTLRRVRAIWSSGGGRNSSTPITAANYTSKLNVACTDPATQNPDVPENFLGDTTSPDYTVSGASGRYGIYPVSSRNILIEESESVGASDAGIYVGQTSNAIIRNSRAAFNVFGFEIENVQGGEYAHNVAECNTGGFLIYDLDNLQQYGDRSRMYGNLSRLNNTYNFAASGFVGDVPSGSGMITLSYDRIDIFDNTFRDNNTGGIIHTSYAIFPPGERPRDNRLDWYTEGVHIFRNKFINNGNALPAPTTSDLANSDLARLLPALVGLKNQVACLIPTNSLQCLLAGGNGYRGAHILWDGLLDSYAPGCAYPRTSTGAAAPADARGKPQLGSHIPDPGCQYNAYKFDTGKAANPRIVPEWFSSCIAENNEFSSDSLGFANFHGTKGLEAVVNSSLDPTDPMLIFDMLGEVDPVALAQFPSSFDLAPHRCGARYGRNLPLLDPVVLETFERSGDFDPAPSAARIAELCGMVPAPGAVNFAAAPVNCPTLDQYRLFGDAQDPTSAPNGGGLPFALTTKLFSDYSVKYRVAWLPPGETAVYRDAGGSAGSANVTINFPVGTIIAKTFAFANEDAGTEVPMETRLLIKRVNSKGLVRWDGLPYLWKTEDGRRVARLAMGGSSQPASWKITDLDSGRVHTGNTAAYSIPHANQCLSCHAATDKDAGAAPIGLKPRFLNKPFRPESGRVTAQGSHPVRDQNQIEFWCDSGFMTGCPADLDVDGGIARNVERVPVFNKPGDSGAPADSDADIEARARAWLEVNCQHCHNERGFAASTGFYLDSLRPVNTSYGICKRPTAAGTEGGGGRTYDIHPGLESDSVLGFRIGPAATTPSARMPPLARSVVDVEGHALIRQWINDVVVADEALYPGSTACEAP